MSNYNRTIVYVSEGTHPVGTVDCTQTGVTLLTRTRETTLQFHPLQIFIKVFGAANIDTPAVVNIGTNAPDYNNIVDGISLQGPNRTFQVGQADLAVLNNLPSDTDININVVTAATGTNPNLNIRAAVEGLEL
jgi:hypothetical protein